MKKPHATSAQKGRICMHCNQPAGKGPRELRPYGPSGRDVCAECVFKGPPERIAEAKQQLGVKLAQPNTLLLDATEQVGPRPLTPGDLPE